MARNGDWHGEPTWLPRAHTLLWAAPEHIRFPSRNGRDHRMACPLGALGKHEGAGVHPRQAQGSPEHMKRGRGDRVLCGVASRDPEEGVCSHIVRARPAPPLAPSGHRPPHSCWPLGPVPALLQPSQAGEHPQPNAQAHRGCCERSPWSSPGKGLVRWGAVGRAMTMLQVGATQGPGCDRGNGGAVCGPGGGP